MKPKKTILLTLFICLSAAVSHAYTYWWMDINVEGGGTQRVYFFKEFRHMEQALGIPSQVPGGPDFYKWWVVGSAGVRVEEHTRRILSQMRQEGFVTAFVLWNYSRDEYVYQLYWRRNGVEYSDLYYTDRQIRLD